MKKLMSVLVIAYGSCAALWYLGANGYPVAQLPAYALSMGMVYVTMGLLVGFAGTFVYKFGQWLMS